MTIPTWAIATIISLAMLAIAVAGFTFGRRKDRDSRIENEATERQKVLGALEQQAQKLDNMDRTINDKLSRMDGQYTGHDVQLRDHERRIICIETEMKIKKEE